MLLNALECASTQTMQRGLGADESGMRGESLGESQDKSQDESSDESSDGVFRRGPLGLQTLLCGPDLYLACGSAWLTVHCAR